MKWLQTFSHWKMQRHRTAKNILPANLSTCFSKWRALVNNSLPLKKSQSGNKRNLNLTKIIFTSDSVTMFPWWEKAGKLLRKVYCELKIFLFQCFHPGEKQGNTVWEKIASATMFLLEEKTKRPVRRHFYFVRWWLRKKVKIACHSYIRHFCSDSYLDS